MSIVQKRLRVTLLSLFRKQCYWFTVEFGLCREGDSLKAYGAGLLSSSEELEYCLTDVPKKLPFDPFKTGVQEYPITSKQPIYFVADSFDDVQDKLKSVSFKEMLFVHKSNSCYKKVPSKPLTLELMKILNLSSQVKRPVAPLDEICTKVPELPFFSSSCGVVGRVLTHGLKHGNV
jgi:hypothetical protein